MGSSEPLSTDAAQDGHPQLVGPRVILCEEQGPIDVPLGEVIDRSGRLHLNPEIQDGDYFSVSLRKGTLTLRARGHVGYVPLNDRLVVYVKPRVPISNLSRMARVAGLAPTVLTSLRGYETGDKWSDALVDVYAVALIEHVERLAASGLFRDYVRRYNVSSFPHGRVLVTTTIQALHARGIKHEAHITWFDRSIDNAVNQCIKYAIWWIAQQYVARRTTLRGEARKLHRRLNALYSVFDGVHLDHQRRFMDDALVTGERPLPSLRAYYRDPLNVALAAISRRAVLIESTDGPVYLPSLVINMNNVFEAYVRNVLHTYAAASRWAFQIIDGNHKPKPLFDAHTPYDATPDIVVERPDESAALVLEVKNIPKTEREAINQAVTYAVCYRTNNVVLVNPCAAEQGSGLRLLGSIDNVAVYQYRYNLGAADLSVEDAKFGSVIGSILTQGVRKPEPRHDLS